MAQQLAKLKKQTEKLKRKRAEIEEQKRRKVINQSQLCLIKNENSSVIHFMSPTPIDSSDMSVEVFNNDYVGNSVCQESLIKLHNSKAALP